MSASGYPTIATECDYCGGDIPDREVEPTGTEDVVCDDCLADQADAQYEARLADWGEGRFA